MLGEKKTQLPKYQFGDFNQYIRQNDITKDIK